MSESETQKYIIIIPNCNTFLKAQVNLSGMGGLYKRKRGKQQNKYFHRAHKTKHYQKDTDQIYEDIKPENKMKLEKQEINDELPGLGQYYCIPCARYFNTEKALKTHKDTKSHKKAEKRLQEKPYDHKEAEEFGKY